MLTSLNDRKLANIFYLIHYLGAVPIPVTFLHFIRNYFLKDKKFTFDLTIGYSLAVIQIILFLSGLLVAPLTPKWEFTFYTNPGLFYPLFMAYFFSYVIYSFYLMVMSTISDKTNVRKSKIFFIIATGLGYMSGSSAFLLVYVDFLPPYGIILFILFPMITTYAIVKHRLMDIEVIIKKTLVFAGLASFTFGVFAFVTFILQNFLSQYIPLGHTSVTLISVLLVVLGYEPIRKFLINITDRFLFQKRLDYPKLLKDASQEMAAIKSLNKLSKVVVAFLVRKARIRNAAVFAQMPKQQNYLLKGSRPHYKGSFSTLDMDHPLIVLLKEVARPIDLEEAINQAAAADTPERQKYLKIVEVMESFDAQAVVPSFLYLEKKRARTLARTFKNEPILRSLLFLGPKKSDEPYNGQDLDVFFTLAQESAVSVENARLYDEAVQRRIEAEEARRKVEEMERQLAEAERKSLLAKLTGGIAHEVRNPLSYIQNVAYFMKKMKADIDGLSQDFSDPEASRKKLFKIAQDLSKYSEMNRLGAGRIHSVVQTIEAFAKKREVDVSKLSENRLTKEDFKFDAINVEMLLTLVLEELRFKYQSSNQFLADIQVDLEKNLPSLYGDQNVLIQVFMNLLSNAHDAMKKSSLKKIMIKAYAMTEDKEKVHLEFQDTGGGISEELKEKVWENLFTTKAKEGGSGFGLFWSKNLIDIHGGKIWFESKGGVGTTFHLIIPAWSEKLLVSQA